MVDPLKEFSDSHLELSKYNLVIPVFEDDVQHHSHSIGYPNDIFLTLKLTDLNLRFVSIFEERVFPFRITVFFYKSLHGVR